ncbi:MAG: SUMF1/EgtB/PvdO family nonheme iron enzyme [Cyanobacteria bacterium]|nr:SUMF1/EgtB/PvdO family nonheme iron enzyme [Cyanobacteriota bacterium]
MPNSKGQPSVYVSSTFIDLEGHRAALKTALEKARYDVECMEKYTAFDQPPLDRCLADVAATDVYVLLIAHRYGYRPLENNPQRRSITQLEYEQASRHNKLRLVFTVHSDHDWKPKWIDSGEDGTDLAAFRAEVEASHGVGHFTTADQLASLVLQALQALRPPSLDSGSPRSRSYTPADLQHWVDRHQPQLSTAFLGLASVQARQVHVPLDVCITPAGATVNEGPRLLKPEDLKPLLAVAGSHVLLLSGDGGAGKTSLAFAIARWWLEGKPGGVVRLPVLIETALGSQESVADRVRSWLRNQLPAAPEEELAAELIDALLAAKRLIPIVDHLSELTPSAREQFLAALPLGLVLVTSRSDDDGFRERPLSRIVPQRIAVERLQAFFLDYLRRKGQGEALSDDDLMPAQAQLKRIVGDKPIMVLLAQMFIDDVIANREQGLLAGSVPELMLSYVRRLDTPADPALRRRAGLDISEALVQRALRAVALASHRQGPRERPLFQPLEFSDALARSALLAEEPVGLGLSREQAEALLGYLIELRLLLQPGAAVGRLRFPLDPLADHLAAAEQFERLEQQALSEGSGVWEAFLAALEPRPAAERELMRGFLLALRDGAMEAQGKRALAMPPEAPDRLAALGFLDPEGERYRLALQRARKWMWELGVPVASERRDAIGKLAAMAAASEDSERRAARDVASRRLARMLAEVLPERQKERRVEQQEAAVVLGLIGTEIGIEALERLSSDGSQPPELRRAALEALGLTARDQAEHRLRIEAFLEGQLRADSLDLLVTGEEGWAEHDRHLPPLQGASRALQLAASAELPLLGSGPGRLMPMLTLTALQEGEALRIRTEVVTPAVWRLPLPDGEQLELVVVEGRKCMIGSPKAEAGRDIYLQFRQKCEGVNAEVQRTVNLKAFALVRHPLTQAQWRVVAALPRLERDISSTPGTYDTKGLWESYAQPSSLAVDSVSWNDCQEWLRRLNRWLVVHWKEQGGQGEARQLALPSESQREAACRASSGTPFHFGDTLDSTWTNYDGNYTYGPGRKGAYRQRPVPVGFFGLVNRWGLAELHGQLLEWCADQWHRDPRDGSTGDGSPLEGPDADLEGNQEQAYRLLRGGSWIDDPRFARAAFRNCLLPDDVDSDIGVRPGCFSPPGSLLGP